MYNIVWVVFGGPVDSQNETVVWERKKKKQIDTDSCKTRHKNKIKDGWPTHYRWNNNHHHHILLLYINQAPTT